MEKNNGKEKNISLKINGKKTDFEEDLLVYDWRLGKSETAASDEKMEEDGFNWMLPDQEPQPPKEYKKINYVTGSKKNRKKFRNPFHNSVNLLMSIIGAIVVGAVLGFGTLKVINTTDNPSVPAAALKDNTVEEAPGGNTEMSSVKVGEFHAPVIQGGVYSKEETLIAMQDSISVKGVNGASIEKDGQWFLLLGVSGDVATAKLVGEGMTKQGVEVYAKDFVIGEKEINASLEEKSFLEMGNTLFGILAQESSNGLLMGKTNQSVMDSISSTLKELESTKVEQEILVKMKETLVNAGNLTMKIKSPEDARKAQNELLRYIELYGSL
ncbi:hypothetical protein [Rossellomorea aquimaris]|uniref:hypothetical protein n=1 Tax=Rossellomorea aquimaris TaxID=189382 RepID=UPI0007D09B63|nr:hypothetical protein [Rossellomorea aquimaris]